MSALVFGALILGFVVWCLPYCFVGLCASVCDLFVIVLGCLYS